MSTYLGTKLIAGAQVFEGIPTGVIMPFAGQVTPEGWLPCNGQEVSRTTYATLYAAIGETYGAGDGSTTFNLPDLKDKTLWGANSNVGTVKSAGLPNITGLFGRVTGASSSDAGPFTGAFKSNGSLGLSHGGYSSYTNARNADFNASRSNSIYGNSDTVQPPALCLNMIIKY